MQTFIPFGSDFNSNAKVLDRQRLGKQRVECLQILRTIRGINLGWRNHPAVRMWEGYDVALASYGITICSEWTSRGYKDTCASKIMEIVIDEFAVSDAVVMPPWIDDLEILISHRSNLIRKKPGWYGLIWPEVPNDIPYKWPS